VKALKTFTMQNLQALLTTQQISSIYSLYLQTAPSQVSRTDFTDKFIASSSIGTDARSENTDVVFRTCLKIKFKQVDLT
jgi:hypothetical protein